MPKDRNGRTLLVGDSVEAPPPNESDSYIQSGWLGTIISFKDDLAVVQDMDGDVFDIEFKRLNLPRLPTELEFLTDIIGDLEAAVSNEEDITQEILAKCNERERMLRR